MRRLGRDALVSEALTVLAENPQASMLELAQAIGVGRTTLYRNFGDRKTFVAEVARLGARRFGEAIMRARPEEGDGMAAVERICTALFTLPDVLTLLFADNPIITDEVFAEVEQEDREQSHGGDVPASVSTDEEAAASAGESDDVIEQVIARGQGDGSIAREVPVEWAAAFVFLTIGSGHLFSVSSGVSDPAGRVRALDLTIRAVRRTLAEAGASA
jgi:AcrR family transcriptional regulator